MKTSMRMSALPLLLGISLAAVPSARAQSISNVTVVRNGGNCADQLVGTNPRSETKTVGAVQSSTATSFSARYSEVVAADGEAGASTDGSASCTTDYTIQFDVTSPAKYALTVDHHLLGALTAADDGAGQAQADVSGVTGTQTGGTLTFSNLDLDDPGSLAATASGGNLVINESSGFFPARIDGTSNGVPQTHTLDFSWNASCSSLASGAAGGDECAVRLGERAGYPSETASDYPGIGGRRQENDGHFVNVNLFPAPPNDECASPIVVTTTPFTDVRNTVGASTDAADPLQSCTGVPFNPVPARNSNSVWYALTSPADGEIIVDTEGSSYDTVLTGERGSCGALTEQGCSDDYGAGLQTSRIDIITTAGQTYLFEVTDYASPGGGTLNISIVYDPDCGNGFIDSRFGRPGPGEECDDGAANGTGSSTCTADCTIRPPPSDCGNGVLDVGEQCDEGAGNGTQGSCCTAECTFRPAVTPCRAAAGACDLPEVCSGTSSACPADAKSTAVCRPAVANCDVAESCDGTSNTCPTDAHQLPGTVCRPAVDNCDLPEVCTGAGAGCPADTNFVPAGTPCRITGGACDIAESCTGTSGLCPPDAKDTQVCRTSAGVCDVADECDGVTDDCPADGFQPATLECRVSTGVCDPAENCSGAGANCPGDAKSTAVCRPAAGPCDNAESCDGAASNCPPDVVKPTTAVCRANLGECDVAEHCDGATASCPPDAYEPNGTSCEDDMICTTGDQCISGVCAGTSVECGDGVLQSNCGESCDDGNTTSGDGCSSTCALEPCGPLPETGCRAPVESARAMFVLKDKAPDDKDRLLWKWAKGAVTPRADFGDPLSTTSYQLCVYDESGGTPHLKLSASAPAGGMCAANSCWRATTAGFKYSNPGLLPDGLLRVLLKEGLTSGKAKITVKGKGMSLPLPTLPLAQDPALTVQLKNSDGVCWGARYSAPATRNQMDQFKDRAD